jgi:hypothetical protein
VFELEAIKAVSYASRLLGIKKVEVNFVGSDILMGKTITSMYLPDQNLILFNQDWLSVAKLEDVILTAFHEARHAYQKSQIDGIPNSKHNESKATIQKWKEEFGAYYLPNDQILDDPNYIEQEIEKDACKFAIMILKKSI